jgi:hypothetical protein
MESESECRAADESPARPGQVAVLVDWAAPWLQRALCRWDGLAARASCGTTFTGFAGLALVSLHVQIRWSSRELQQ